jgi:hypothetical protein
MNDFYAAFIESSYRIEGDERSRTNPGHGYPAETVYYTRVEKFSSKEEMEAWVKKHSNYVFGEKFHIVKCTPMVVTTTVSVDVSVK